MSGKKLLLLLLVFLVLQSRETGAAEPLIVSGCSVSNVGYLNDLARDFTKETGIKVFVRGGGSLLGLTELGEKKIDFAASCKSKERDDPEEYEFVPVVWDALVFIVNKSNPVSAIRPEDVRDIYEGKVTNWRQLGGPDLTIKSFISTPKGMGGIGEALAKMILQGKTVTKQPNSSLQASSVAIWEQLVEKTPEGFASTGFASARKRDVKMLKVNGQLPTRESILSGKYPFKRPLFLVMRKDAGPEVRSFVEFALSKKGQRLISSYGIVPFAELK